MQDTIYLVNHMRNGNGTINYANVALAAASEAAELFLCMADTDAELDDWGRLVDKLNEHLRAADCDKIHDICQAIYAMGYPRMELEGLYLAREDEGITLLYYQIFVGQLELFLESAGAIVDQEDCDYV